MYRYQKLFIFVVVLDPVSNQIGSRKSLGVGIGKFLYREKNWEPVLEKFGTGKSLGTKLVAVVVVMVVVMRKYFLTWSKMQADQADDE